MESDVVAISGCTRLAVEMFFACCIKRPQSTIVWVTPSTPAYTITSDSNPAGSCGTTLAIPHPHEDGGGGVVVGGGGDGDAGLAVVLLLCWQHAV